MERIDCKRFLELSKNNPIIDVRSPSEFRIGHIPGAINIPVLNDVERTEVGIIYKQKGLDKAIQKGIELTNHKIDEFKKSFSALTFQDGLLIHCWRGGLRSEKVAELIDAMKLPCFVLAGGYKAYRSYLHKSFTKPLQLMVISGPTGSGKTDVLKALQNRGEQVIDLEAVANHCGSVFGGINKVEQSSTEQFQNNLFHSLNHFDWSQRIWIEDENQVIGTVVLPESLWRVMQKSPRIRIELPLKLRVKRLVSDYGSVAPDILARAVMKLEKRLGNQKMTQALASLYQGRPASAAEILLEYYDKAYLKSFIRKQHLHLEVIHLTRDNPEDTADLLLQKLHSLVIA